MNREEKLEELKKKAQVFFEKSTFVFVKAIKSNGGYELRNGPITEVSADFFMLQDVQDNKPIPIFFLELLPEGSIFEPSRREE